MAPATNQAEHIDLEDFFDNGAVGLHIVGADGTILRANNAEMALLGFEQHEYVGRSIVDFHADALVIKDILERLRRGEKIERYPARLRAKDGSLRHVQITSSAKFCDNGLVHTRCFTVDVTNSVRAEQRAHDWYHQLLDALPAAVYTTDTAGKITYCNEAAVELAGRRPVLGKDEWCVSWRLYQPDGTPLPHEACPMAIALKEQRPIRGAEAILERPDGTRATFIPYPTPLRDPDTGEMIGAVNMLVDISERKIAEETEQLLIKELNHRIKNTLANVQALARHSLRSTRSSTDFVDNFSARLQALARVHGLLSDRSWSGADLRTLVREQLKCGATDESRVIIAGPAVHLVPDVALRLALVLHELATNSHKYGALSVPEGTVSFEWSVTDLVLSMRWTEVSDRVATAPLRRGFGSTLIEEGLKSHGGTAHVSFTPAGLIWELSLVLQRESAQEWLAPATDEKIALTQPASLDSIAGKRVLVVEDEPLIAIDQAANLEEIGAVVVGPVGTITEALRTIETRDIDAALLDANLAGSSVDEIAAVLTQLNIPFAFVSGYGRENLPRAFRSAPLLAKPCSPEALKLVVTRLVTSIPTVTSLRDRRNRK